MKAYITSIDIEYSDVSTLDSSEKELIPIKKVFKFKAYSNGTEIIGSHETGYFGDEIWLPSIIREIEFNLNNS